jgi:hypothetical protein
MVHQVNNLNAEGVLDRGTLSLSPLLFVLATDLLQSIVNQAYNMNLLKHHLGHNYGYDYHIVQYADDTLIILPADAIQLFTLKELL